MKAYFNEFTAYFCCTRKCLNFNKQIFKKKGLNKIVYNMMSLIKHLVTYI